MAAFDFSVCPQCNNPRILGTPCQNCSSSMAASQPQMCVKCRVFPSVFLSSYCTDCDMVITTLLNLQLSMTVSSTDFQPPPLGSSPAEPVQQPHGFGCLCVYCCAQSVSEDVKWDETILELGVAEPSSNSSHAPQSVQHHNPTPAVPQSYVATCTDCNSSLRYTKDEFPEPLVNHVFEDGQFKSLRAAERANKICPFKLSSGSKCNTKVSSDYRDHLERVHSHQKKVHSHRKKVHSHRKKVHSHSSAASWEDMLVSDNSIVKCYVCGFSVDCNFSSHTGESSEDFYSKRLRELEEHIYTSARCNSKNTSYSSFSDATQDGVICPFESIKNSDQKCGRRCINNINHHPAFHITKIRRELESLTDSN